MVFQFMKTWLRYWQRQAHIFLSKSGNCCDLTICCGFFMLFRTCMICHDNYVSCTHLWVVSSVSFVCRNATSWISIILYWISIICCWDGVFSSECIVFNQLRWFLCNFDLQRAQVGYQVAREVYISMDQNLFTPSIIINSWTK